MDTEIIDKLFLELSQFTGAKTDRELYFEAQCERWKKGIIDDKDTPTVLIPRKLYEELQR